MFTQHKDADADAAIRETDGDAALARLSAVEKGYMDDPFIAHLVGRGLRRGRGQGGRPPLINIGTYVRGRAVDGLVEGWLAGPGRGRGGAQIVSLGAGSDTRFWRLATGKYADVLRGYVEVDFAEVTGRKAMAIRRSGVLGAVVGGDVRVERGGTEVHGGKYHLIAGDLRDAAGTLERVGAVLDRSVPTLLLCECVLVYMDPRESRALLRWFAEFFGGETPLGGIVYEMFGLGDAFGRVMVRNLQARGVELPGAAPYGTVEELPGRFLEAGFERAGAVTLRDVWRGLGREELERVCGVEKLDEVEELELVLGHYGVTWGEVGGGGGKCRRGDEVSAWTWTASALNKTHTEDSERRLEHQSRAQSLLS